MVSGAMVELKKQTKQPNSSARGRGFLRLNCLRDLRTSPVSATALCPSRRRNSPSSAAAVPRCDTRHWNSFTGGALARLTQLMLLLLLEINVYTGLCPELRVQPYLRNPSPLYAFQGFLQLQVTQVGILTPKQAFTDLLEGKAG